MIPDGAPPFIILTLCAGMMAVTIALMALLYNMHLLGRPMFRLDFHFTFFHYLLITFIGYLIAQILGITKIILQISASSFLNLGPVIMVILFVENASIISGLVWIYQYRSEPPPLPPRE